MAVTQTLAPLSYNVPFVDLKTGAITAPWKGFLQNLYVHVGLSPSSGGGGASSDDLALSMPEDAGIEEIKLGLMSAADELRMLPVLQFDASQIYNDLGGLPPQSPAQFVDDYQNARIEALEALVTQLQVDLQGLKAGVTP